MSQDNQNKKIAWKTVKVFISSTFKDMHAEREALVKRVFPVLRERLLKYRLHFDEIDLRWGITKDQSENEKTLELCFQQIDESRPFFIGIIGNIYGHIARNIPEELFLHYPWLKEYPDRSFTELEILSVIASKEAGIMHTFFFFRDPEILHSIPPDRQNEYCEPEMAASNKLAALKNKIRSDPKKFVKDYSAKWDPMVYNYATKQTGGLSGLEDFEKSVLDALWSAINREFALSDQSVLPEQEDVMTAEQDFIDQFIATRLRAYVARNNIQKSLNEYINENDNRPYFIIGPPGCGKSSILANFYRDFLELNNNNDHIIVHFTGASPSSVNLNSTLNRFCTLMNEQFKLDIQITPDTHKLCLVFKSMLLAIPKEKRLVIIMDAVDQFYNADQPQELAWLPEFLPANVKFLLTVTEEDGQTPRILERAREIKVGEICVGKLSDEEQLEVLRRIPSFSGKILDHDQVVSLLENPATRSPLFLAVALEELRGWGSYDQLNDRIASFPRTVNITFSESQCIRDIFVQVFDRLIQDFDPPVVQTIVLSLSCSRHGMTEEELPKLTGKKNEDIQLILRSLRPYLIKMNKQIAFCNSNINSTAEYRWLNDKDSKRQMHKSLAEFFNNSESVHRKIEELPWQLCLGSA